MRGAKPGTIYLKKSCRRCCALVPSDNPSVKEHYKCCLGIALIWQNVDETGAFYCPMSTCPKPTSKKQLEQAMINRFPAPTGHDNSGGVGRATTDAVSTSGST